MHRIASVEFITTAFLLLQSLTIYNDFIVQFIYNRGFIFCRSQLLDTSTQVSRALKEHCIIVGEVWL